MTLAHDNPLRFIDPDGMLSKDFIDDLWNKSQNGSTWINQGNGSFSYGNVQRVQEQGGDQNDPKKKGQEGSPQGDLPYLSDLHKRAKNFNYDKALGLLKDGEF